MEGVPEQIKTFMHLCNLKMGARVTTNETVGRKLQSRMYTEQLQCGAESQKRLTS